LICDLVEGDGQVAERHKKQAVLNDVKQGWDGELAEGVGTRQLWAYMLLHSLRLTNSSSRDRFRMSLTHSADTTAVEVIYDADPFLECRIMRTRPTCCTTSATRLAFLAESSFIMVLALREYTTVGGDRLAYVC
jgi:hypothetical protein